MRAFVSCARMSVRFVRVRTCRPYMPASTVGPHTVGWIRWLDWAWVSGWVYRVGSWPHFGLSQQTQLAPRWILCGNVG